MAKVVTDKELKDLDGAVAMYKGFREFCKRQRPGLRMGQIFVNHFGKPGMAWPELFYANPKKAQLLIFSELCSISKSQTATAEFWEKIRG